MKMGSSRATGKAPRGAGEKKNISDLVRSQTRVSNGKNARQTRIEVKIGSQSRKSANQTRKEWEKVDIMPRKSSNAGLRIEKVPLRPAG